MKFVSGYRFKELLSVDYHPDEAMVAVAELGLFTATDPSHSPMKYTARPPPASVASSSSKEFVNSKLLRSLGLNCERLALMEIFRVLGGPHWKCKDNWGYVYLLLLYPLIISN